MMSKQLFVYKMKFHSKQNDKNSLVYSLQRRWEERRVFIYLFVSIIIAQFFMFLWGTLPSPLFLTWQGWCLDDAMLEKRCKILRWMWIEICFTLLTEFHFSVFPTPCLLSNHLSNARFCWYFIVSFLLTYTSKYFQLNYIITNV